MTRALALLCLLGGCLAPLAEAQSPLKPPFGLRWGESQETLLGWAARHTLDVSITLPAAEPDLRILRVEPAKGGPLPDSKAAALEVRFQKGRLFEITEHHSDPMLPGELFETRFEETRKQLAHQYGPLLPNRQERMMEDQFVTRTRAFHREPVKGLMLMLLFTEIEDSLRKSKASRYSIVYRNENLRKELTEAP